VLNPAAIKEVILYIFYRAVRKGNHSSIGIVNWKVYWLWTETNHLFCSPNLNMKVMEWKTKDSKIEDTYYLTYTGFDGINALGCLAISKI
jgi:predicted GH43/DUF377 family glycosyl hydrolase